MPENKAENKPENRPDIPKPNYTYPARAIRVIDGDTIVIQADVGFRLTYTSAVRLLGVNAPERQTRPGKQSKAFTSLWLNMADQVNLTEHGGGPDVAPLVIVSAHPGQDSTEKYGRWLARVFRRDGACLNDDILLAGMATVMDE